MSRETEALAAYMRALNALRDALPHMLDHEDDTNGGPWWAGNLRRDLAHIIRRMEAGLRRRGLCGECGAAPEFCHCGPSDRCEECGDALDREERCRRCDAERAMDAADAMRDEGF